MNNQGGLASLNQTNKTVRQYASDLERRQVKILDKYFKSLSSNAADNDVFYEKQSSVFCMGKMLRTKLQFRQKLFFTHTSCFT